MKKVLKLVKGKKDDRRESGGMSPCRSGELLSPTQTPDEEGVVGMENGYGYSIDFGGKDKTLSKLHKAAWQGNLDKLKSALKKVDVDAVDRHNRTALHLAVAQGHPNIVWFLLGNNAKTSICDDEGHTPLLKAIECAHKECMTLLLNRGANVDVADYTGNTGLHIAVTRGAFDTASSLLKKAADTDVSNNAGDYPLHIATRLESKDLVDLLLSAGALVDVLDRENRTPLMLAAKTGNRILAQLFVDRGAQLTVVDSNGWTAQDYAMLGGHEDIASWLSSHAQPRREDLPSDDHTSSWPDTQIDSSERESASNNLSGILDDRPTQDVACAGREKPEDSGESPEVEAIPPYCQPPRSWEMIQAGMIDENKYGSEPKRRSITALGTLHSRRGSFAEPLASSPKSTLSLNRRRPPKEHNAFAKNRFSLNETESLTHWWDEGSKAGKESEAVATVEKEHLAADSHWDNSVSGESWRESRKIHRPSSGGTHSMEAREVDAWSGDSGSGTLGRQSTLLGVDEMWVTNPQITLESQPQGDKPSGSCHPQEGSPHSEKTFPPPPTGLELGVDMARSIRCLKGLSVDHPSALSTDKNLWRNAYERHSLDCLDERDVAEGFRPHAEPHSDQVFRHQKPRDKLPDVSRRINEQLECYDQALRELAGTQNYYSLPCKGGGRGEWRRRSCEGLRVDGVSGGSIRRGTEVGEGAKVSEATGVEKKRKKHMLLAMREVQHAVQVGYSLRTSMEEEVLSPLEKPEEGFDSDEKSSPKGVSSGSGGNSPADENPFFGIGRQETVLERNDGGRESEDSETGEESTLWLQDEGQRKENSDEDVAEIGADEGPKHGGASSFSPLGVIHREMEEESRGHGRPAQGAVADCGMSPTGQPLRGENEEIVREQSPDVSLSSGPIEPLGAEKDSGSEPESSHNDISPPHNYAFKSQHEWLKSHLKAATSEKNKLEELTAQLTEKAERLQYELADAKEAGKSRDEVIRLLQDQLARMEAAYTKSLEESVQSRLQLSSHEQEILHLKELCYRYQEEKEAAASGVGGDFLHDLQLRIKILEEEKEKMREEISNLETEKSLLEGRLRAGRETESEMVDQCQRWKERCKELEEVAKGYVSKEEAKRKEGEPVEQVLKLELGRKLVEARQENVELRAKMESLETAVERGRRKAREAKREKQELKRRNVEMERELRGAEKEAEEMNDSGARGAREKSDGGAWGGSEWKRESERLRQLMQRVEEQMHQVMEIQKGGNTVGGRVAEGEGEKRWIGEGGREGTKCLGINILGETSVRSEEEEGASRTVQDFEYLELKKQILCLESKMSHEKNLRHSLENEMLKMRVSLSEKENLEMEVDSLKRKIWGKWPGKSGMELVEYERDLQAKREKYLTGVNGGADQSNNYKAKCQLLAKEREKLKQLSKSCHATSESLLCPIPSLPPLPKHHPHPYSRTRLLLHPSQLFLHPRLKTDLDFQLDKSIHRYTQEPPSTATISNM